MTGRPNLATRLKPLSRRRLAYLAYDAGAIAASLLIATNLRMSGAIPPAMLAGLLESLPVFVIAGLVIFHISGVYGRVWRLAGFHDLTRLVEAATIAIIIPVFALLVSGGAEWMPVSIPIIAWFVLTGFLISGRMWQRVVRDIGRRLRRPADSSQRPNRAISQQRALVVGEPEDVEVVLRHFEVAPHPAYRPVGILDVHSREVALQLRRVPIMGDINAIEHVVDKLTARNERPTCIILAEGAGGLPGRARVQLVTAAQALGLSVLRAPAPAEMRTAVDLQVVDLADLLDRPQAQLDAGIVSGAIAGHRVLLTGAGGTIGRELARQIAAAGPAELVLIDASEFNLYSVEMELRENYPDIVCRALLCSIRQRQHVMAVFAKYKPHYVFHAAALKHVPLVETNVCAGVQTNVLGTCNVADAAKRFGVVAMVQVSTDKAVNPVGVMGATKRLGELYCQALDLDGIGKPSAPRFMTVRFGNVLGSSGSLIPLLQRQLDRRVPLTVTHPDITRYFMTVHEAVQLVLYSMARALECNVKRGRVIVLDMGEPVKIIDIARRMVGLSGLVPDRDVPIEIVGLRPGEKLFEELFDARETRLPSELDHVFEAEPVPVPLDILQAGFTRLADGIARHDEALVRTELFAMLDHAEPAPDRRPEPAFPQDAAA
jgi:O-antigen biosynthesis protein WbqV